MDSKSNDFAWEVFEKLKSESVRDRGCVGKAAISCESGAKKQAQQQISPIWAWSFRVGEMSIQEESARGVAPPRWGGANNNIY